MFTEREFALVPVESRAMIANLLAESTGERDMEKIGDGKIAEALGKLFALFLQFAPLFMEPAEVDRKIGDGTIFTAFLSMLNNPNFQAFIAAMIAAWAK